MEQGRLLGGTRPDQAGSVVVVVVVVVVVMVVMINRVDIFGDVLFQFEPCQLISRFFSVFDCTVCNNESRVLSRKIRGFLCNWQGLRLALRIAASERSIWI